MISFARDTSSIAVKHSGNGRMVDFPTSFFSSREHGGFGGLCPGKCCRIRILQVIAVPGNVHGLMIRSRTC